MVSKITSVHNERVKHVRSLIRRRTRQRENRFVIEGTRLVDEALGAGLMPALVFFSAAWAATPDAKRLVPLLALAEEGTWLVSDSVLAACTDAKTSQGVIAVLPFVHPQPRPGLVLILDRLRNPGNLGTILRSAEAAGVGQVILTPGTVDLYNPKVVRGAMGAHFRLPVASLDWPDIVKRVRGQTVWLADAHQSGRPPISKPTSAIAHENGTQLTYETVDWTVPSALIVGGEAAGASKVATELATGIVSIPMSEGTESLNAAMAATVILFEAARQRRA